ncbi:hypothetical protein [Sulfobacillus thermosulfidooxidans]|uniref:hypothetical protein n=1 Tax=Sulfobacillus thermosulfidooxidans TaxID=28034 RepID=UPI0006B65122|nr:hypothetical protein [Sulfobacillus thermosulfidooxidans]
MLRFYRRACPYWTDHESAQTLAGLLLRPEAINGRYDDYLMVYPRENTARGKRYYVILQSAVPGNPDQLFHTECPTLIALHDIGYRRVSWKTIPPRWQQAFFAHLGEKERDTLALI